MISYIILLSRQGKVRLAKWYTTIPNKTKNAIIRDVTQLVLSRKPKTCNVIEYKGLQKGAPHLRFQVIYRRYASLFFLAEIDSSDNELITLEILHRYVETLDQFFGNVCELDLIFNFDQAYYILDELILGGEIQESSKPTMTKLLMGWRLHERDETLRGVLRDASLL